MKRLGSFSITTNDSLDFARASGDFNPLHLDPVTARRTRFGQTLIHGVNGTLKALDLLLEQRGTDASLGSLKVKYSKPATQNQELTVFCEMPGDSTRLELFADGIRCQIIEVEITSLPDAVHRKHNLLSTSSGSADDCLELGIDACNGLSGAVDLFWDQELMTSLFPSASRYLPPQQLAALLASTRIVGMKCPGLHSVFAQLNMRFTGIKPDNNACDDTQLGYRVLTNDPRIDRIELALGNICAQGTVEAFFRAPPVNQASFIQIAALVSEIEFSDQRALVIGASRGLGEIITKVLAAGGAKVVMTYAAGMDDAIRVSQEIGQHRIAPDVYCYDAIEGSLYSELAKSCASVTHIYYLASPTIKKNDSGLWDRRLFAQYCNFYINGLATLLQQVAQNRPDDQKLQLFIPSSIFLEQSIKGFDEYIAAKTAAERFARCYENSHRHCTVVAPRLPRLLTDQTAGVKNIDEQQTLRVIIEQLRLASAI